MAPFSPAALGNTGPNYIPIIKQTPPGLPTKTGGSKLGGFHHVFVSSLSIDFPIFLPGPKSLLIFDLFSFAAVASKSLSHPRCAFSSAMSFFSSRFGQLALMPSHYGEPSLVLALLRSIFGSFCSSISAFGRSFFTNLPSRKGFWSGLFLAHWIHLFLSGYIVQCFHKVVKGFY